MIDRLEGVEEVLSQLPPGRQLTGFAQLSQAAKELLRSPDDIAMKFADVSDYAIRDWSRMPFGAGLPCLEHRGALLGDTSATPGICP